MPANATAPLLAAESVADEAAGVSEGAVAAAVVSVTMLMLFLLLAGRVGVANPPASSIPTVMDGRKTYTAEGLPPPSFIQSSNRQWEKYTKAWRDESGTR